MIKVRSRLLCWVLSIFNGLLLLRTHNLFDEATAQALYFGTYGIGFFLIFAVLILFLSSRFKLIDALIFIALLTFFVFSYIVKDDPETAFFYFSAFLFLLFIRIFSQVSIDKQLALQLFRTYYTIVSVIIVAGAVVWATTGGEIDTFFDRVAFGFGNPNYYGRFLLCSAISFLIVKSMTSERKFSLYLLSASAIFLLLCVIAVSRNSILAFFVFILCFFIQSTIARITVLTALVPLATIGFLLADFNINSISSGRLFIWSVNISTVLEGGSLHALIGANTLPDNDFVQRYSSVNASSIAGQNILRSDNNFIDFFVNFGFVGLFIFLYFCWFAYKKAYVVEGRDGVVLSAAVTAIFFQGIFESTLLTVFSPSSLLIFSILMLANSSHKRGREN